MLWLFRLSGLPFKGREEFADHRLAASDLGCGEGALIVASLPLPGHATARAGYFDMGSLTS